MKRTSTLFLKAVLVLIGFLALAGLLWEPHLEGRNVGADWMTIYFRDPFLAFVYVGSLPFFAGLYQAFKLLGYIENDKAFSPLSLHALKMIRYYSLLLIGFIVAAQVIIVFTSTEDSAGIIALGIYASFAVTVVAAASMVFEKLIKRAVAIKSENDLTI